MSREFPATHDEVDAIAAWTVIRAARELARRLGSALEPLDLTPVEFGILVQLAVGDHPTQAELARAVGVRPQSITTLVAALDERGLLDRGATRGRGRPSRIALTAEGRALLARAWPIVQSSNTWFREDAGVVNAALHPLLGETSTAVADVP